MSKANELEESILKCLIDATRKQNITKLAKEIQKSKGYVDRAIEKMIQKGFVSINKNWINADLDPRSTIIELEWKGFAHGVVRYNIEAHNFLQRHYQKLSEKQREFVRVFSKVPDAEQRQLAWWHVFNYELETGRKFGSAKCDKKIMFRIISDKRFRKAPFEIAQKEVMKTNPNAIKAAHSKYRRGIEKNLSKMDKAFAT